MDDSEVDVNQCITVGRYHVIKGVQRFRIVVVLSFIIEHDETFMFIDLPKSSKVNVALVPRIELRQAPDDVVEWSCQT